MGDSTPISFYCSEEYLDYFLGEFCIQDRPKRMMHRFLDDERKSVSPLPEHELFDNPISLELNPIKSHSSPKKEAYDDG